MGTFLRDSPRSGRRQRTVPCLPPAEAVYDDNAGCYEDERQQSVYAKGLVLFTQQQGGENGSHNRVDEAKNRDPADGIVAQQDTPECVGCG